jgi:hypothetical protein
MSATWPPPGVGSVGRADNRPLTFRSKFPDESLVYSLPIGVLIEPTEDVLHTVLIACAPSGPGELELLDLIADDDAIWLTLSGGQPGRIYTLKYSAVLASGNVRQVIANITVARAQVTDQPPAPPSTAFGTPVRWPPTNTAVYGESKYNQGGIYE